MRVIAPDTGGGFGPKAVFHPEELAHAGRGAPVGRPLKWIEDRRENFVRHRDASATRTGTWRRRSMPTAACSRSAAGSATTTAPARPTAWRSPTTPAPTWSGPTCCPRTGSRSAVPHQFRAGAPTRGAGRPQGTYVMERLLDAIAARLGAAARRGAPAQPDPARADAVSRRRSRSATARTMTYDSGDYPECQRRALAAAGWADFPARQAGGAREAATSASGLPTTSKATGRGPFESAALRVGAVGQDRGHDRRDRAGPGHQDHAGAARVRRAGRAAGRHHRGRGRHRRHRRSGSAPSRAARR